MSVPDAFKNLSLDTWYKALVYIGGLGFIISLLVDVRGLTNGQLQLLSSGFFLVGIGEWKNHKAVDFIKPPNIYTGGPVHVSGKIRQSDWVGLLCDASGVVLILLGIGSVTINCVRG